jgi:hypothetical protein
MELTAPCRLEIHGFNPSLDPVIRPPAAAASQGIKSFALQAIRHP